MGAIPLAALSIGGSSQAPIPATRDGAALDNRPVIDAIAGPKRRGKNVFDNDDLAAPFRKVAEFKTENRSSSQHKFLSGCALYVERLFLDLIVDYASFRIYLPELRLPGERCFSRPFQSLRK